MRSTATDEHRADGATSAAAHRKPGQAAHREMRWRRLSLGRAVEQVSLDELAARLEKGRQEATAGAVRHRQRAQDLGIDAFMSDEPPRSPAWRALLRQQKNGEEVSVGGVARGARD
jgi:hypothetical protein